MELALSEVNDVSDEEEREQILETTRVGVANLGVRLSYLLVDFLFTMSHEEEELMQMFQHLRAKLEPRIQAGRLFVVDRIFALLELGEKDLRDRTKHKKLKNKVEALSIRVCAVINGFVNQIMSLEAILSAVLTRPVQSEDELIEYFKRCEKEQDALMVKIRNHLEVKMSAKVEELWAEFEVDE